jgi:ubiquinone biosynthesis protein
VRVPTVHWDRTSKRVLTLEWVEGMRLVEAAERFEPAERHKLAEGMVETLLQMFVSDGLFHADLHPGNIVFHDDGTFTLLDFGMYGELTPAQRDRFVLYLVAVVQRQVRRACHHFTAQTHQLPGSDEGRFFERFSHLAETFYASPLRDMSFARVYLEMMKAGYAYGFVFPSELMLHAKALTTAETLLFTLDPELRFEDVARPIIAREFADRIASPNLIRDRLTQFVPEFLLLGEVLPTGTIDDAWDRQATDEVAEQVWRAAFTGVRGRLEHGGLWNALLEPHARAALAGTIWADHVTEILEEAWERYYELEPDLPVEQTLGATFTTHLAIATLAIYRALRARGAEKDEAYRLIYDAGWRLYTRMGEPPLLLASATTRAPVKRLRIATDLFRTFPFGEPGYLWQDVDDTPHAVGFDCLRCPVAEFFARHGESELCVHTWCELDFPLAEKWGGRLERSGTLASGAARCDFHWHAPANP